MQVVKTKKCVIRMQNVLDERQIYQEHLIATMQETSMNTYTIKKHGKSNLKK